jgi:hypothetical protein
VPSASWNPDIAFVDWGVEVPGWRHTAGYGGIRAATVQLKSQSLWRGFAFCSPGCGDTAVGSRSRVWCPENRS